MKCSKIFLRNDDSGVLVCFHDEDQKRITCGYGVAGWFHKEIRDLENQHYLCFRLDKALEKRTRKRIPRKLWLF